MRNNIRTRHRHKNKVASNKHNMNSQIRKVRNLSKFNRQPQLPTIDEGEYLAAKILAPKIGPYLHGLSLAINVAGHALELPPALDHATLRDSFLVSNSFLIKMMNDLRVLQIIASKGYAIQSATIASSLYESSFILGYLGDDDQKSRKWINHTDRESINSIIHGIKSLTKNAIRKQTRISGIDIDYKELGNTEYKKYQILCMAKHSNPLIQKEHGFVYEHGTIYGEPGPEASDAAVKLICFSLENSISFVMTGLVTYVNEHLTDYDTRHFVRLFNYTKDYYNKLKEESINRWGSENI
ncbi:hypothetical protein V3851_18330 [Paenibacillus sp. M1]|uniref:Uncharacterized protein n=1 Tax=Paenibacillus haidiansis TaxID=1574488 RepID=A0ABU7VVJ9_9BACL